MATSARDYICSGYVDKGSPNCSNVPTVDGKARRVHSFPLALNGFGERIRCREGFSVVGSRMVTSVATGY